MTTEIEEQLTSVDDTAASAATNAEIELPAKQAKRHEPYAPDVMDFYRRKFALRAGDLAERRFYSLVKSKIDSDVHVAAQNKRIAALEAKVTGLLQFVAKYAKVKPASAPSKSSQPRTTGEMTNGR